MTEIEKQAIEVYQHYKRRIKYTDDSRIHGCRHILRLLMDGVTPETLKASADNYRREHSHRDEKYLLSAKNFYSYCGPNGIPEWSEYQPGAYDRWVEPSEPPESTVSDDKPETTSAPRMTFETFLKHSGKAAEQMKDGDD